MPIRGDHNLSRARGVVVAERRRGGAAVTSGEKHMTRVTTGARDRSGSGDLVAATLATTAQNDAHAATGSGGAAAQKTAKTRLHIHVTGCDRCSIQLQHAVTGKQNVWTSAWQRIGSDHVAPFKVRTTRTQGLSFMIRAPWQGNTGAVSNIVTRYAGHSVDTAVGRKRVELPRRGRASSSRAAEASRVVVRAPTTRRRGPRPGRPPG